MEKRIFLKSGEFARLCQTTKDTLLHYDRKGVFRPAYVSENGYRRYGIGQYFEFDLISVLRDSGSSLEDVKRFQEQADFRERLAMLKERVETLEKERLRLERRECMLRNLVEQTEEVLDAEYDVIRFEERKAERVRIFPVQPEKMLTSVGSVECYANYLACDEANGDAVGAPLGVMVPAESVAREECRMAFLFARLDEGAIGEEEKIPAGRYAVMFHHDNVLGHSVRFSKMLAELRKDGWTPCGNAWLFDQMSLCLHASSSSYTAKYVVRVERSEESAQGKLSMYKT